MGAFSIWHWIVVAIIFSPLLIIILGIALLGFQRKVPIRHSLSVIVKNGYIGFCWTYLFFGWIVPIIRGEIGVGVLHLVLTFVSLGLFQLVMPFLYNKQFMTRQLTSGWDLAADGELLALAQKKLNITA